MAPSFAAQAALWDWISELLDCFGTGDPEGAAAQRQLTPEAFRAWRCT